MIVTVISQSLVELKLQLLNFATVRILAVDKEDDDTGSLIEVDIAFSRLHRYRV